MVRLSSLTVDRRAKEIRHNGLLWLPSDICCGIISLGSLLFSRNELLMWLFNLGSLCRSLITSIRLVLTCGTKSGSFSKLGEPAKETCIALLFIIEFGFLNLFTKHHWLILEVYHVFLSFIDQLFKAADLFHRFSFLLNTSGDWSSSLGKLLFHLR